MAMKKSLFQTNLFKSLTIYNGKTNVRFTKSTATSAAETSETENDSATDVTPATVLFDGDDTELREATIEKNRNKSRLLPQHQKMLHDTRPYDEAHSWIHNTVKYKRMMFGRYGLASGVDPRICFYSNNELADQREYEQVAFPFTLQEMMKENAQIKAEKEEKIRKREDDIDKKMAKLDMWTKELNAKIAKKEADAKAAKERKERLVEEVRRQFGFKLDTKDDRFKELVAQKEKEDKKKQKEERRKIKEEKMMAKLLQRTTPSSEEKLSPTEGKPPTT
ncbi:growth arrest and DNA damage-inducible proteins-interacting protein 1 [Bradysia coprophila]|uniref:growth arrest and DNA damage-inducible proteins-interacting protein 1 n=1 Tax=Bradysia coprophila TaxID=38358 RepID=UPI00187D8EA5|nr:growth arrest and DNA damage-inducible proteins-interacting protein 1 [Bradysia coprophila]